MNPSPNHRWYIVCLTLANQALVVGLPIYSFALFVPYWLEEFDLSRSTVMIAITISSLATGGLSPFAGKMFDQYPIRILVLIGVMCVSLSLFFLLPGNGVLAGDTGVRDAIAAGLLFVRAAAITNHGR